MYSQKLTLLHQWWWTTGTSTSPPRAMQHRLRVQLHARSYTKLSPSRAMLHQHRLKLLHPWRQSKLTCSAYSHYLRWGLARGNVVRSLPNFSRLRHTKICYVQNKLNWAWRRRVALVGCLSRNRTDAGGMSVKKSDRRELHQGKRAPANGKARHLRRTNLCKKQIAAHVYSKLPASLRDIDNIATFNQPIRFK